MGCLISNSDFRYVHWNPAAEAMFGYQKAEVLGKHPFEVIVAPWEQSKIAERFARIKAGAMDAHGPCEMIRKGGERIICLWHNTSLLSEDGEFMGMMSLAQDITAKHRLEQAQIEMASELKEKNKELESIVYVASHDLRSPLVNIQGFGQELGRACDEIREILDTETDLEAVRARLKPLLEVDMAESLHFIQSSSLRMDSLLSGLLRLSRLGRKPLLPRTLEMNQLTQCVLADMRPLIGENEAQITCESLPACEADESQIKLLLGALLDNAIKHRHPDRTPQVRVSGRVEPTRVVYCVEDNGVGIGAQYHERLYELFYRLQPGKDAGEGLGLTIAQRVAGRHGGKVWVESTPGVGSRFFFALPTAQSSTKNPQLASGATT